jgi:hypothetical protein
MSLQHGGHTHAPEPRVMRYTNTCSACGCGWKLDDLSTANPVDDMCLEPVKWHPRKCLCHSEPWAMAYLDARDRLREERLLNLLDPPEPQNFGDIPPSQASRIRGKNVSLDSPEMQAIWDRIEADDKP